MALLDDDEISPGMFGPILWKDDYAHLPFERLIDLATRIFAKPDGSDVLLIALSMKLHRKDSSQDTLGHKLRGLGLQAATQSFRDDHSGRGGTRGFHINNVIGAALKFDGNEVEKKQWLNAIFSIVDERYGYIHSFEDAIETTVGLMPDEFLTCVFQGDKKQQAHRSSFIRHGWRRRKLLSRVKLGDLIDWCQKRTQAGDWGLVAYGIQIWENNEIEEGTSITPIAMEFLEAAPDPKIVLQTYADRVKPRSWSESRANIMQPKADAIKKLTQHERTDIANAAKLVSERLKREIEQERVREQREDREREQRFE